MAEEYEYYEGRYTGEQIDNILDSVQNKIQKPTSEGQPGYVLHTDGSGGTYWEVNNDSFIHIRYASHEPNQDEDMKTSPDAWMGIYSGASHTAPEHYTEYQWYKIQGEGVPPTVVSQISEYQVSSSGSDIPTGSWSQTIPTVPQGQYLWTKTTISFSSGNPMVIYTATRYGMDGSGSVSSVNNVSPDSDGNISLDPEDIGAYPMPEDGIPKDDLSEELTGDINSRLINGYIPATETVDCNEVTKYLTFISNNSTNTPAGLWNNSAYLITIGRNEGYRRQFILPRSAGNTKIYWRNTNTTGQASWSDWSYFDYGLIENSAQLDRSFIEDYRTRFRKVLISFLAHNAGTECVVPEIEERTISNPAYICVYEKSGKGGTRLLYLNDSSKEFVYTDTEYIRGNEYHIMYSSCATFVSDITKGKMYGYSVYKFLFDNIYATHTDDEIRAHDCEVNDSETGGKYTPIAMDWMKQPQSGVMGFLLDQAGSTLKLLASRSGKSAQITYNTNVLNSLETGDILFYANKATGDEAIYKALGHVLFYIKDLSELISYAQTNYGITKFKTVGETWGDTPHDPSDDPNDPEQNPSENGYIVEVSGVSEYGDVSLGDYESMRIRKLDTALNSSSYLKFYAAKPYVTGNNSSHAAKRYSHIFDNQLWI